MAAGQKKVVVRMSGGSGAWGYLSGDGFVTDGAVEMMAVDGRVISIRFNDIEMIAYVKDFNLGDANEPERLGRRVFAGRPRGEGLWLRMSFRELAPMEGLASFDMGLLDGLLEDRGVFVTPPDTRGNTMRVFVPRHALRGVEVLGWISSPARKLSEKAARQAELAKQAGLFDEPDL